MIDTDRMESQPLDGGYKCKKDPHSDANHLFYHTQYILYNLSSNIWKMSSKQWE